MRLMFERTYDVISIPLMGYDYYYNSEISLENQVKDVEGMIIQQGLDDKKAEIHLVGHGWGSVVAQAVAKRNPKKYKSVVLVSMPELPVFNKKQTWE